MFRSYEPGRADYVTLIANYQPLQDAYGGPNYFCDGPERAVRDPRRQQRRRQGRPELPVPLQEQAGRQRRRRDPDHRRQDGGHPADPGRPGGQRASDANLQLAETYTRRPWCAATAAPARLPATHAAAAAARFDKPVDNIGVKTIPDYAGYAAKHIHNVNIPGCSTPARVFVGQRQDPFAVNLGTIFDLVNAPVAVITNPALIGAAPNTLGDKNVTTLALEVHKSCLTTGDDVIGGWTTASLRQARLLDPHAAVGPPDQRKAGRRLGAGVAPGHAAGQRGGHRPEGQGQVQRLQAHGRRPVRRLRDEPDVAGAAGDRAGAARHRAHQLPAHRPGDDLPDRHQGREPAEATWRPRRCCA